MDAVEDELRFGNNKGVHIGEFYFYLNFFRLNEFGKGVQSSELEVF